MDRLAHVKDKTLNDTLALVLAKAVVNKLSNSLPVVKEKKNLAGRNSSGQA